MDNPYHYPITIRLEPVEGEPIHGDEMFVARSEYFPELAMAEGSPQKAYDGLMAMTEKVWAAKVGQARREPMATDCCCPDFRRCGGGFGQRFSMTGTAAT